MKKFYSFIQKFELDHILNVVFFYERGKRSNDKKKPHLEAPKCG